MATFGREADSFIDRGFSGVDANGFLAKFKAWVVKTPANHGPGWFVIDDQSSLATDPYIVVCDVESPVVNAYNSGQSGGAPKFIKIGYESADVGYVYARTGLWHDVASHTFRGIFGGYRLNVGQTTEYAYLFMGGAECMLIGARQGSSWSVFFIDEFAGISKLLEGTDKVGVLQSGVTAGSSVVCQLGSGQAANFTVNKYYFIYDFVGHSWVNYAKVTARDTVADTITLSSIAQNFPSGAVVCAYAHRFYSNGPNRGNTNNYSHSNYINIPYISANNNTYVHHNQTGPIYGSGDFISLAGTGAGIDYESNVFSYSEPNDEGEFLCIKPLIYEYMANNYSSGYSYSYSANRKYGKTKNLIRTKAFGLAFFDYRTAESIDYLTIGGNSYVCNCFRYSESTI